MTDMAAPVAQWDVFLAEYADVRRSAKWNLPLRPCMYCGALTRAGSQVCLAHEDLIALDQPEQDA